MRKSASRKVFEVCNFIFMILLCGVMLYPFIWTASASLSNSGAVAAGQVTLLPVGFTTSAYQSVLGYTKVWTAYGNTLWYTVVGTAVSLILTICGAYPLSRSDFYGKGVFVFFITLTMIFSGGLIPSFLVNKALGLYNTRWAIILPGALSTMNMIIMRTFFQNIPDALEEAATIDGCSDFQILIKIILPLSTASIMTIGMFYAVGYWNSWFSALIYLRDADKYPLQLVLRQIVLQNQVLDLQGIESATDADRMTGESIKYAVVMVATIPILMVYPFVQKYFVKGVMIGSIKG